MADPEVRISIATEPTEDVDMDGDIANGETAGLEGFEEAEAQETTLQTRTAFVDYLKSPIVTLLIGTGASQTSLTAHQALLNHSPYFASALDTTDSITLPDSDIDAASAVLEYLYTGEYFPHKLSSHSLRTDPSLPKTDTNGEQLLKHAKVYTLAEKLGMPALRTLAHSKIHLVESTAVAELTYARYVYSHTDREDTTIRRPVASFWGQRSHVLRHEAEGSFKELCLEFPEFAYDVLSHVLDAEEKREEKKRKSFAADDGPSQGSTRKRQRG